MYNRIFKLFLFVAVLLPFQSMGWGTLGHRIVGEIADTYLTTKAKAEIKKILGNESVAMSSNWADFIKSDSSFKYLDKWHYIDFDNGITYEQMKEALKNDTATDAYTKLNFLIKELKKKSLPMDKKKMYLKLLIHITGDIHQPLHVGRTETAGGNLVKVNWFNDATNLHSVWDSRLIDFQQLSYSEYTRAINYTTASQRKAWQKQPMTEWLWESYSISEQLHNELTTPTPRLGYEYNFKHIAQLNQQLVKGGVHLAGLLNEIFK